MCLINYTFPQHPERCLGHHISNLILTITNIIGDVDFWNLLTIGLDKNKRVMA